MAEIIKTGELIPISENNGQRAVSARDLYNFLCCTERFQSWFDRQLQYGFADGIDYTTVNSFTVVGNGAEKPIVDYAMTISMAKEVSMIQRNEKGKQARQYFIACEQKLQELSTPSYQIADPIKRAEKWIEEEEKLSNPIAYLKKLRTFAMLYILKGGEVRKTLWAIFMSTYNHIRFHAPVSSVNATTAFEVYSNGSAWNRSLFHTKQTF